MSYYGEDREIRDGDWAEFGGLFTKKEFMCKCGLCGEDSANHMRHDFMHSLHILRLCCDFPFIITSGYRCKNHPEEVKKIREGKSYGDHVKGKAVDINCYGENARKLLFVGGRAFNVWGVKQHGFHRERFIHLGVRDGVRGVFYTY